ncbi:MAG: ABC transporter permease [Lachnospiraceae bacterium]|nr:ABC transporter permease [Lachnospiraceae bacterium]
MKHIYFREMRLNAKNLIIWSLSVGILGMICILLYSSMQGDMEEMADAFSNMGMFSDAFGMSTLSIATIGGFFATEVGTVHGLGSAMFASILAITMLSKEEEGHSGEFLLTLPVSRGKVVIAKGLCILSDLVLFTVVCALFYILGFVLLGEDLPAKEFVTFMGMQLLMNAELAGICYGISALSWKNRMGLGLGLVLFFYIYDLMGRIVPDAKPYLYLGPYSYANASQIFAGEAMEGKGIAVACLLLFCGFAFAFWEYRRRDLAA